MRTFGPGYPLTGFTTVNILICPDKFKGSLSAKEVCNAVAAALSQMNADTRLEVVPLADGGEGTCDLLTDWYDGTKIELDVSGPLFSPVSAYYGLSGDGSTAFIEMAVASGLMLLRPEQRNPLHTTTLGTGEMIADALRRNVKKVILGIGGSATNDAGVGMAAALGFRFYDASGVLLQATGENLIHIRNIDASFADPLLRSVEFVALCDVTNPLYGPEGAAYVYGPQKGASRQEVLLLDAGLRNFRNMVHKFLKRSVDFPGAGAAGGLGAGARAFLNASMERGITHLINSTQLQNKVRDSHLIITGEGQIDNQTFSGKVVSEVLALGRKAGKPVVAICGKCAVPAQELSKHGISKVIALVDENTSPESAMKHAADHITRKIVEEYNRIVNLK